LLLLQLTLPQVFNGCEPDAEAARSAAVRGMLLPLQLLLLSLPVLLLLL